jgi:hypothetical protein
MKKRVKAIMLPTDRATSLWDCGSDICYDDKATLKSVDSIWVPQHIYIISDEVIKEDDWYYHSIAKEIRQWDTSLEFIAYEICRKIISTSDLLLTNKETALSSLPNVSQSFLKAFVESDGKEDWEVEYNWLGDEVSVSYIEELYWYAKLDSNNCVILSEVEYKERGLTITSVKTCEHPFKRLHWVGTKVYCNKCKTTLVKPVE